MSAAKVPDNKSGWNSIDIFLFSNGQKSSPPRKYHLVTDQLDWWKATLCFLAKSQYGSLHNMVDLYTIEGQKVETPMQLSHNTAYVAVAPPDLFINGSYEKYLIKATRSWEKGQIRRLSNLAGVNQAEVQIGNEKSNSDNRVFEPARVTRDGSVTLKTIVASMVDNQASVIVKPDANSVKNNNNIIKLNPVKQSNETPKPPTVKNLGTVKRNSLPSPPRSRKPSLRRKDSVKINMDATKDRSSLESNNNKITLKSKVYKPLHKTKDSLADIVLTKVEEVLDEVKSTESFKVVNMQGSTIKASDLDNVVEHNEASMTTNYYMNAYSEKPSIAVNPNINLSDNVNRQGGAHELFDESHHFVGYDCEDQEKMDGSRIAMSLIANEITDPPFMEHGLSSTIQVTKPENDVALINKEGTVNLKLNIEIWNYPNETKNIPTVVMSEKQSVIILKREKESQLNVEEKTIDDGNHKVIIVKCACLNRDGEKAKIPVDIGNSNLLVYLPILKLDENCKRCDCKEEKETNLPSQNTNVDCAMKKTNSCLSLYKGRADRVVSHSEILSKNNSIETKLETNTGHGKNEITTIKRKSVAIKEDQELYQLQNPTKLLSESVKEDIKVLVHPLEPEKSEVKVLTNPLPHLEPVKSECVVMKKESTGILHKTASKFTQTEWCDVLLEAKLQNDGHYSFHLPPLEILKNYKL